MKSIKIINFCFLFFLAKLLFAFNPEINYNNDTNNLIYQAVLADNYYPNHGNDSCITFNLITLKNIDKDNDPKLLYDLHFNLCKAYLNNLDFDSALFYATKSLRLLNEFTDQDRHWKIKQSERISYLLGHLYSICNKFELSLSHYFNGIAYIDTLSQIDPSFDKNFSLSCYYTNLGHVFYAVGKYAKAFEYYNLSINHQQELDSGYLFYSSYNYLSIAELLVSKGDFYHALVYYEYLLGIYESQYNENTTEISIIYNNIGLVYFNKGDYLKSLNYFNKSLSIIEDNQITSPEILANIYNNLGDVYRKLNRNKLAKSYFDKVYNIYALLYNEHSLELAFIYNNFANYFKDTGNYFLALKYYNKSLEIRESILSKKHDKIAQIYQNIGLVYYNQYIYDSALKYYQKSICANSYGFDDMRISKNPDLSYTIISKPELLETLTYKAEILLKLSQTSSHKQDSLINLALESYDLAIKISDRMRDDLQNEKSRILLNSKIQQIYTFSIDYLFDYKSKYSEKLFEYFERSKNYELFSALTKQKAKMISGISNGVLKKEKEYKSLINYYRTQTYQNKNKDSIYKLKIKKRLFEISKEYELFVSAIEEAFPCYNSLKFEYTIPKTYEIQDEIDNDQAVISYYYEDTSLYICVISKDTIVLNKYYPKLFLEHTISKFLQSLNLIHVQEFYNYSHILYQTLIEPIRYIIIDKSELLIIPYGQLYYIPFETLICENWNYADYNNSNYLINNYTIKYHYSASLWYQEIKKKNKSLNQNNYLYEFSGFAPVFLNEADKIKGSNSLIKKQNSPTRLIKDYIPPLPFSGEEVHSIYTLFNSVGKSASQYLLKNATEKTFKSNLSNSKYIHIATHGFINKKEPGFSGLIFFDYLSNPRNIKLGDYNQIVEHNDGILYLNELYTLDINAELIVISACEGGNGKLENSEGIISMARGFIYSGVDNIILSLFKIPDKQTKDLMVCFYNKIISGYSLAEALRLAKLQMIESQNNFPKLWGGFILIGN